MHVPARTHLRTHVYVCVYTSKPPHRWPRANNKALPDRPRLDPLDLSGAGLRSKRNRVKGRGGGRGGGGGVIVFVLNTALSSITYTNPAAPPR